MESSSYMSAGPDPSMSEFYESIEAVVRKYSLSCPVIYSIHSESYCELLRSSQLQAHP